MNITRYSAISLIGMPGAGKSTVGVVLAKTLGFGFLDTDLDIQKRAGTTLQTLLERDGYQQLRKLEEEVILDLEPTNVVVATGGSAVYSQPAMAKLAGAGPVIYLQAQPATLRQRIAAHPDRGIANDPAWSFEQVFAERTPLYQAHGQVVVDVDGRSAEQIAAEIVQRLSVG